MGVGWWVWVIFNVLMLSVLLNVNIINTGNVFGIMEPIMCTKKKGF